jgi:hypothetical protein
MLARCSVPSRVLRQSMPSYCKACRTLSNCQWQNKRSASCSTNPYVPVAKRRRIRWRSVVSDSIETVFVEQADFLKIYFIYCANQGRSLDTLQLLRKHNPAFAVFLQVCCRPTNCNTFEQCADSKVMCRCAKPIQSVENSISRAS